MNNRISHKLFFLPVNYRLAGIALIFIFIGFISGISRIYSQVSETADKDKLSVPEDFNYREKIFLHTDRKLYLSGEIIWFKGYCTYRNMNVFSDVSKVMYVEILDGQNKPILSEKILLEKGTGHGNFQIPRSLGTGIYNIRAYTRWMTNFPPEYWFTDRLYIVNPFRPIEVFAGDDKSHDYNIVFYPEAGRLNKGIKNEIGFRAKTFAGYNTELTGWVIDQSGDTITEIKTWKQGFGIFSFTPEINQMYRVVTVSSDGIMKESLIPFQVPERTSFGKNNLVWAEFEPRELNIELKSDKEVYSRREKVTFTIDTRDPAGRAVPADLSVSVYKSDQQTGINPKNICQYLNKGTYLPDYFLYPDDQFPFSEYHSDTLKRILQLIWSCADTSGKTLDVPADHSYILPETRGITVTGTVYNSVTGTTASGIKVYVSQPGKTAQIYTTTSGGSGRFQVRLLDQFGYNDIIVMPAQDPDKYYISLDEEFCNSYSSGLPEYKFYPDENTIRYIERLMINLQVDDAFNNNPIQPIDLKQFELPDIYGDPDESVHLEDYIKLPSVDELFYELVKTVLIKRKRNNNFELQIIDPVTRIPIPYKPLFLVDGVPVHDINPVIIYMDPVNIEKIDVVTSRFVQGNESYYGIINVVTKQADYKHFDLPAYAVRKPYKFFQVPYVFNSPDYSSVNDSIRSHPDLRNLLFWDPDVITGNNGETTVSFYTADDISDYRIVIQGLSENGLAGCLETAITVK
jgi:MG2 domain